ncbi:MAG: phosphoribosyltransferase family protein [Planctomycetota bacterium]|nr:phosphoribosyltransferase family protein [Planctomycetota bacterium]
MLVRRLKFDRVIGAAAELGQMVARQIEDDSRLSDEWVLAPVPLSPSSFRTRGFNQAELIARKVAKLTGMQLRAEALSKVRNTLDQASLHRKSRLTNVLDAFKASEELVANAKILIIDDVMTTGATLHECAKALKFAGASDVAAAVAAYSLPPDAPRAFENDHGGQA